MSARAGDDTSAVVAGLRRELAEARRAQAARTDNELASIDSTALMMRKLMSVSVSSEVEAPGAQPPTQPSTQPPTQLPTQPSTQPSTQPATTGGEYHEFKRDRFLANMPIQLGPPPRVYGVLVDSLSKTTIHVLGGPDDAIVRAAVDLSNALNTPTALRTAYEGRTFMSRVSVPNAIELVGGLRLGSDGEPHAVMRLEQRGNAIGRVTPIAAPRFAGWLENLDMLVGAVLTPTERGDPTLLVDKSDERLEVLIGALDEIDTRLERAGYAAGKFTVHRSLRTAELSQWNVDVDVDGADDVTITPTLYVNNGLAAIASPLTQEDWKGNVVPALPLVRG
jgi:hypothetical protein